MRSPWPRPQFRWRLPGGTLVMLAMTGLFLAEVAAQDWPMWRYDAGRGAATPHPLPDAMELLWWRQLPPARTAWPETQDKLQFDTVPQPIVMGNRLFVPSTVNDSVSAYDTKSGELQWRFFADGPVRFAPAGDGGRVFFVSDDGFLYCLSADAGKLLWKVNGGPAARQVIGNHRLVASWPARGGPVVHDGRVYFSASIWPFMGIFIHAVDAETGAILWTNSGDGTNYTVQPHGAPSFAGVVPQGHLAVSGTNLIVPGGRSTPAVFDLATGKLKHFVFDHKNGGHHVMAGRDHYYVAGGTYGMANGRRLSNENPRLVDRNTIVFEASGSIYGRPEQAGAQDALFAIGPRGGPARLFLKAASRVYTAGDGKVASYDITGAKGGRRPAWSAKVKGKVHHMLAADQKLFVVTEEPRIYCFGLPEAGARGGLSHALAEPKPLPSSAPGNRFADLVTELVANEELRDDYALALGMGSGRLIAEILNQSNLHLVVLDRAAERVEVLRNRCDEAGLYGTRVAGQVGELSTGSLPPYFASLMVCEDLKAAGFEPGSEDFVESLFRTLRPYGGTAILLSSRTQHEALAALVKSSGFREEARLSWRDGVTRLTRPGALPDTDDWTHQYGNPEQTGISKDKVVKAPLGLLWFGGPSHEGILPRHGHGPSPQVAGGRLFIEGPHMLRAVDVYTGRVLWEKKMKNFGRFYNTTKHFPGAGEIGSNYVSLPDRVYAVYGKWILELDAATGRSLKILRLGAASGDSTRAPYWGYLAVQGDFLIATSSPVVVTVSSGTEAADAPEPTATSRKRSNFWDMLEEKQYSSGSRRLVVFNRHTGKVLWKRDAALNFRHNNIAVSETTVFCTDAITQAKLSQAGSDPASLTSKPTLYALDLQTGRELWKTSKNVFGTFLNYSPEHDVLLQAGSKYRDRASDEVGRGMIAYRGKTGEVLWHDKDIDYGGPCLLWRDRIITNGAGGFSLDLFTGKRTGWSYQRMYGCNTAIGSEHLLTFRSGAAGFYDLANQGGTGNIGGFRSSCTNNLIVANGVLNAPDYTRTCNCAYQNQCSLALIHMPEAEFWTFGARHAPGRVGINFGAPGDRRDPNGTLWTEFPSVGGPSDEVTLAIDPSTVRTFRHHASTVQGEGLKWVAASGILGAESITIPVMEEGTYRVRLLFSDPEDTQGGRMMQVTLQGKEVLKDLDVAGEAGGPRRLVVREFEVEASNGEIVIELAARETRPTLINGVEVVRK